MKCTTLGLLTVFALTLPACGDDSSGDPVDPTTSGGSSGDPTDPSGSPTGGTTGEPGTDTVDPSTTSDDDTTGDPGSTSIDPSSTSAADSSSGDTGGTAGASTWTVVVDVDLGGVFEVTSEAIITIEDETFSSDVTTQIIAGGKEVHEIPLAGTFDGTTLTMEDTPFSIVVGGVTEDFLLSGTAVIDGDALTGSGTFTSSFDGGKPFPGSYTITDATLLE